MEYICDTEEFKFDNTVVCVGKFDGFHLGHESLIGFAAALKKSGARLVIFTFDVNPKRFFNVPETKLLYTKEERKNLKLSSDIDVIIEYPFTSHIKDMSPENFCRKILTGKLGAKFVVCGDDFKFGHNRTGDTDTLKELGERLGFGLKIVDRVTYKGRAVSSTYIKECILKGDLASANYMLGRPYSLTGKIIHGRRLGTGMGFPTINIEIPEEKLMPPNGVYASKISLDGKTHYGISNTGVRPTFGGGKPLLETNIFDFDGKVYGHNASIEFFKFIRAEADFESPEKLEEEVNKNISQVRDFFGTFLD